MPEVPPGCIAAVDQAEAAARNNLDHVLALYRSMFKELGHTLTLGGLISEALHNDDLTRETAVWMLMVAAGRLVEPTPQITKRGIAVVESGLTLRQAHEIETGCSPAHLCDDCSNYMEGNTHA